MKKLLFAGAVAAVLAAGAPAQAHPDYHYEGGCSFSQVGNEEDGWRGQVNAAVVATDAATGAPAAVGISVNCRVYVNNAPPGTVILTASGTGAAVNAGPYDSQDAEDDVITLCTEVTVGGEYHEDCGNATTTPIVPPIVVDAINLVIDTLNNEVFSQIDPTLCPHLGSLSPGVPGVVDITPDGDVYIAGEFFWDCPPYATA